MVIKNIVIKNLFWADRVRKKRIIKFVFQNLPLILINVLREMPEEVYDILLSPKYRVTGNVKIFKTLISGYSPEPNYYPLKIPTIVIKDKNRLNKIHI